MKCDRERGTKWNKCSERVKDLKKTPRHREGERENQQLVGSEEERRKVAKRKSPYIFIYLIASRRQLFSKETT